jgi:hypothetical protein
MIMCHKGENVDEEEKNTSEEVFCWSICRCKWFKYSPIFGNPTPHIRTVTSWLLIFELGFQIGMRTPKLQTGGRHHYKEPRRRVRELENRLQVQIKIRMQKENNLSPN